MLTILQRLLQGYAGEEKQQLHEPKQQQKFKGQQAQP